MFLKVTTLYICLQSYWQLFLDKGVWKIKSILVSHMPTKNHEF